MTIGFCSTFSHAQQAATTSLTGTIKDPNGALIAGARISIKHKATGSSRETTTNSDGVFVITNLSVGIYEVRVQATGFADKAVPDINLQIGQTTELNVQMTIVVEDSTTIDDRFAYDLINTTGSVVDGVIRDFEVQRLPLNGRNFLELALLIPGNAPAQILILLKQTRS
jgi:hypothetical protein